MCIKPKNPAAQEELRVALKDVPDVRLQVNNLGNGLYETVAKRKGRVIYRVTEKCGRVIRRDYSVVF